MLERRPPLSYSLPAFHPDGYANVRRWLDNLAELGFQWITLHPTWLVHDTVPLTIRPDVADVTTAVTHARELGFRIKIEPHLDWESTLTGGAYEWRRRMYVDPAGEYFSTVLAPMAALAPDTLTLGSELDVSTYDFAEQWRSMIARFSPTKLGHKLNHDALGSARNEIRKIANIERSRHGLPPRSRWSLSESFGEGLDSYLAALDYVAFSFYPSGDFEPAARELAGELRNRAGARTEFAIGEAGLGSNDVSRPWHFDAATFKTEADFEVRRDYYRRLIAWLATQQYTAHPATFWTAGHFDFLGVMELSGMERFRDDALRELVREYNAAFTS